MINSNKNPLIFNPSSLILYSTLIFNLSSLIFLSCSKNSTNPQTVTFSGTVTLEGRTDHSGVKVSLYKPVELDTAIVRINQQYPNIGVQISQETEFDHREHTPVKSTTTNASGSWKIEGVEPGTYNVVAEKDSFGWRRLFEKNSKNSMNFNLKKIVYLNSNHMEDLVFDNSFIELTGSVLFDQNNKIKFKGSNYILFNSDYDLVFTNSFILEDDAIIYLISRGTQGNQIIFENISDFEISNFRILDFIQFVIYRSNISIYNSIFRSSGIYCLKIMNSLIELENNLFSNLDIALSINEVAKGKCSKCVFLKNQVDFESFSVDQFNIENSYFCNSNLNLNLISFNGNISSNIFGNSNNNIIIADLSNIIVTQNIFINNNNNIHLKQVSHTNYAIDITTNFNNFLNTFEYVFRLEVAATKKDTIEAEFNYWGTTNEKNIRVLILDREDFPYQTNIGIVRFWPFVFLPLDTVGIQS